MRNRQGLLAQALDEQELEIRARYVADCQRARERALEDLQLHRETKRRLTALVGAAVADVFAPVRKSA